MFWSEYNKTLATAAALMGSTLFGNYACNASQLHHVKQAADTAKNAADLAQAACVMVESLQIDKVQVKNVCVPVDVIHKALSTFAAAVGELPVSSASAVASVPPPPEASPMPSGWSIRPLAAIKVAEPASTAITLSCTTPLASASAAPGGSSPAPSSSTVKP